MVFPFWCSALKKNDRKEAFRLIAKYNIRNAFMPPTALKLMRQVKDPRRHFQRRWRSTRLCAM
jgi:acetyl-CoA synthetase